MDTDQRSRSHSHSNNGLGRGVALVFIPDSASPHSFVAGRELAEKEFRALNP